ncbi:nucleoside recognition protein [Natronoarchaeum mannanilyticum]|uniref:Nucleoside recognition protein n=1 Tax=Natronoarchaeum mannanilyticum TaxID=926360 RepID=A0AAV3T7N0_9EURY
MESTLNLLLADILPRVASIALFIAVGVALANLAVEFGAVEYIAVLSKPLTGPANLPDEVGTAILATATSPTAGYGMLAEYRESGLIDDLATLVAITVNTFFGFVQHIFTFYAPVLIPILGLEVGVMYVGARAGISLAITVVGILAGAALLSEENVDPTARPAADSGEEEAERSRRERVVSAAESTWSKLRTIVPRLAIVYALVAVLTARDAFDALFAGVEPLTALVGLPPESAGVVGVFAIDTTSGAAAIAPQLGAPFTPQEAVTTMLIGGVVSFAFSTFKRSIPFQYGIWGPAFGTKVILVNTALKVGFIALTVVLLLI